MRCIGFALSLIWSALLEGQSREVPGRDLLNFPLGLAGEAAPLGVQTGSGLWNPALTLIEDGARWRVSVASMNASPDDIGLSAQVGAIAVRWHRTTFGLTIARAAVADLLRTDADPQSIGNEIAYATILSSGIIARRFSPHFVAGFAARFRSGRVDNIRRSAVSADFGVLAENLTSRDVRIGASTFLLRPVGASGERASFLIGSDARILGSDSSKTMRAGYSLLDTPRLSVEHYAFTVVRWDRWELRGGPVRTEVYGASNVRLRLGVAIRHRGYSVGIAREESANGLAPTYHFTLTSLAK